MNVLNRPFLAGPRQDIDRAATPEGAVYRVQDGRQRSGIAWGKRHAYMPVTRSVSVRSEPIGGVPSAIGEVGSRAAFAAGGRAYLQSPDGGAWVESGRAGRYLPRATRWIAFNDVQGNPEQVTIAATNGHVAVAWSDGENVDIQVMTPDGIRVFGERIPDVWQPRLLAVNNTTFYLFLADRVTRELHVFSYSTLTGVFGTQGTVGQIFNLTSTFDVSRMGNQILLAFPLSSTVIRVRILNVNLSVFATQDVPSPSGTWIKVTIYGFNEVGVWLGALIDLVAYTATLHDGTLNLIGVLNDYGTSGAESEPYFVFRDATHAWQVWRHFDFASQTYSIRARQLTQSNVAGQEFEVHHMQMGSRPFNGGQNSFEMWAHTDNGSTDADQPSTAQSAWGIQRVNGLYSMTALTESGRLALHPELVPDERSHIDRGIVTLSGETIPEGPWLPEIATLGTRRYHVAITPVRTARAGNDRFSEACAVIVYEYGASDRHAIVHAAGAGAILGGHLQELHSSRVYYPPEESYFIVPHGYENGFIRAPAIVKRTQVATGTLPPGVYQACVTFEYLDSDGRRHRSRPSNVVTWTVTGASNDAIQLTIAMYSAFEREICSAAHQTGMHVWCTTTDGDTFYRVTPDNLVPAAVTTTPTFVYTIDMLPELNSEVLYTDGGIFPILPAPAHRFGCVVGDRLVLGGLFNPKLVEISRYFRPQEPATFTRAVEFRALLPEDCTALGFLDGQIVAFSERGIFLIPAGQLPNDQGFPALATPTPLPTDVGAVPGSPVIQVPAGLIFQARRGIYLLPRGFGPPQHLSGSLKEDLRDRKLLQATLVHYAARSLSADRELSNHYVYFGVGLNNVIDYVLVLDADSLSWVSTDIVHNGAVSRARMLGSWGGCAVLARNTLDPMVVAGDANLVRENTTAFLDFWATGPEPSPVFRISTGGIRPFGFSGRGLTQCVRLYAEYLAECSVKLTTVVDGRYSAPIEQPALPLETDQPGDKVTVDFRPRPEASEVNSVDYTIEVGYESTIGLGHSEGVLIHGLGVLVEPLPGLKGLPGNKRV